MKIKTIAKLLAQKFDSWANSITDEALRKLVMDNTIITGGSIVSMLQGEKVNDFDLYFRDLKTCLAVAKYYEKRANEKAGYTVVIVKLMPDENGGPDRVSIRVSEKYLYQGTEEASDESAPTEAGKDPTYEVLHMSSNAITLSDQIQIVCRFYGEPYKIHENYDFVHCTCYWTSWENKLVTPEKALAAILTKELTYVGSKYPLCSLIRIRKFVQRGWSINAGQMLKMVLQLNELDLLDPRVLQDQLVGVDSAYFAQMLEQLQKRQEEDASFKPTVNYLVEIINRIF